MTQELFWLVLTIIMTGLLWVPYMIDRIMVRGIEATVDGSAYTLGAAADGCAR